MRTRVNIEINGIPMPLISPEAVALFNKILSEWEIEIDKQKAFWGDNYNPEKTIQGFAYWLVTSGLIEPASGE